MNVSDSVRALKKLTGSLTTHTHKRLLPDSFVLAFHKLRRGEDSGYNPNTGTQMGGDEPDVAESSAARAHVRIVCAYPLVLENCIPSLARDPIEQLCVIREVA